MAEAVIVLKNKSLSDKVFQSFMLKPGICLCSCDVNKISTVGVQFSFLPSFNIHFVLSWCTLRIFAKIIFLRRESETFVCMNLIGFH